jgi:hypothetical protein
MNPISLLEKERTTIAKFIDSLKQRDGINQDASQEKIDGLIKQLERKTWQYGFAISSLQPYAYTLKNDPDQPVENIEQPDDNNALGYVTCPEGRIAIVNHIQSAVVEGREISMALLQDESIVINIISTFRENEPPTHQSMRLSKKTLTLLQMIMADVGKQFGFDMIEIAKEMLKDTNQELHIKIAKEPKK